MTVCGAVANSVKPLFASVGLFHKGNLLDSFLVTQTEGGGSTTDEDGVQSP
ncbi:hypothetical protein ACP70R_046572 [Stipagrostis hirtigluma subsp. patula]